MTDSEASKIPATTTDTHMMHTVPATERGGERISSGSGSANTSSESGNGVDASSSSGGVEAAAALEE